MSLKQKILDTLNKEQKKKEQEMHSEINNEVKMKLSKLVDNKINKVFRTLFELSNKHDGLFYYKLQSKTLEGNFITENDIKLPKEEDKNRTFDQLLFSRGYTFENIVENKNQFYFQLDGQKLLPFINDKNNKEEILKALEDNFDDIITIEMFNRLYPEKESHYVSLKEFENLFKEKCENDIDFREINLNRNISKLPENLTITGELNLNENISKLPDTPIF